MIDLPSEGPKHRSWAARHPSHSVGATGEREREREREKERQRARERERERERERARAKACVAVRDIEMNALSTRDEERSYFKCGGVKCVREMSQSPAFKQGS